MLSFMGPDPRSDLDLMTLIRHQDRQALRSLYRRHGGLAFSLALRMVHDEAAAEEIVQDVFLKVWTKAASYRQDKASVLTWLLRITRNRAIDVLRSRTPAPVFRPWDLAPHDSPTADVEFELAEDQSEVRAALDSLPPTQKRALWLAYHQGLSHSQIAEVLGEPLGTVKSRIRDTLLKMRAILSSKGES